MLTLDTMRYVLVCRVDEVPPGLGRGFVLGGRPLAVFRSRAGRLYAVENRCPHRGGKLSEGMMAGDQVVCPMHAFRFDARTGECDQEGTCPVATFPVEERDGAVFVALPA